MVAEPIRQLVQLLLEGPDDRRPRRDEQLEGVAQILRSLAPLVESHGARVAVRSTLRGACSLVDACQAGTEDRPAASVDRPLAETRAYLAGERGRVPDGGARAGRAPYATGIRAQGAADGVQRSQPD